jgi:hypothetical protein
MIIVADAAVFAAMYPAAGRRGARAAVDPAAAVLTLSAADAVPAG